jgi:DNA invertase Pin-like site-specific DNA recombinase
VKTVLYVRASTEDQQITLEAQKAKLDAYAALYELEVVETIVESESAKSLQRAGLQRALALLRSGEADGLAVVKLDRLTRNVADWQTLIDGYFGERAGRQLFSIQDSIDTRTAAGRLVLNVLLSVAQWERETIAERTRDALRHKISQGERVGAVRFGYDLSEDGRHLLPNQLEQQAIGLMQQLRERGLTLREIAAELTRRGVPTKGGKGVWRHSAVAYILSRAA